MGDFLFGEEAPDPQPMVTNRLDPQQGAVESVLGGLLTQGPGAANVPYGGQFAAPLTGFEGKSLAALEEAALPAASAKAGGTDFASMAVKNLMGQGPQDFNAMFQSTVADPLMKQFNQQTAPALQASLGRSAGGYGGTDRDRLTGMASDNLVSTLGRERERFAFDTEQARRQQVLGGAQLLGGLQTAGISELTNVLGAAGLPRTIQQGGMDRQYAEFVRQQQAEQARLNAMLGFLGIPTQQVDTVVGQGSPGLLGGMAPGLGSGIGMGLGSLLFASSKEFKEDGEPVEPNLVLEALEKLPVDRWKYKGDDRHHVGPYAEDFNKLFGLEDSPGIHAVDAHGVTFAALKAIFDRVKTLEEKEAA